MSFCAALQSIAAGWLLIVVCDDSVVASLIEAQLAQMADHRVGQRPGRAEPRAVKRRPKPHDLLMEPRAQARARLCAAQSS